VTPVAATDWTSIFTETSLGLPNWAWMLGGVGLLFAMGGKR
jgi:hypothetical protein